MKSVDFGNIYLMDHASSACGLKQVLMETFPDCWEDILVCAMHSCSENEALYLCEDWAHNSRVLSAPSSQDISRLLKELDEDRRMLFYKNGHSCVARKNIWHLTFLLSLHGPN